MRICLHNCRYTEKQANLRRFGYSSWKMENISNINIFICLMEWEDYFFNVLAAS